MDSTYATFDTTLMCQDLALKNFNMKIMIYFLHTMSTRMVFFVFSTFYIIGLIDCIGYHGGKYGFHLGFGRLGAPFTRLFSLDINIDPTIFQSTKGILVDPFLDFFHHCFLQV